MEKKQEEVREGSLACLVEAGKLGGWGENENSRPAGWGTSGEEPREAVGESVRLNPERER